MNTEDRVHIKGYRGTIEYLVIPGARDMSVEVDEPNLKSVANADEWQFSFRRENQVIVLQVDSPVSKAAWSEILLKGENSIPSYKIKIMGPSLPIHVNWHSGDISFKNFSDNISITQVSGSVTVVGGEGDLNLVQQEGQVQVLDRKGNVNIDCYNANVDIGGIEGDLKLENFSGETQLRSAKGRAEIISYRGKTRLVKMSGQLNFTNGVSPIFIENFEGELRGKSLQGPVHASISGEANIRVESEEGAVLLKLPSSGAYVNAGSAEGALQVPSFLRLTRLPSQQIRTGRLRGNQGGSVFVRTTTGNIQIR